MRRHQAWGAVAGVLAVGIGVISGELIAAALSPSVTPVSAVGSVVIDVVPPGVKDWAIAQFGTADKVVLLIAMASIIALAAAGAGALGSTRRLAGSSIVAVFGLLGIAAVASRSQSTLVSYTAPVLALFLAVVLLTKLLAALRVWGDAEASAGPPIGPPIEPPIEPAREEQPVTVAAARRRFLQGAGGGAIVAVAAGAAAVQVRSTQAVVTGQRAAIRLPGTTASVPRPAGSVIPAGADLGVAGIEPLVTPVQDFYRIDTALVVPVVDPSTWSLRVTGLVDREVEMSFDELLAQPLIERYVTLACVSNPVGGDLIGNALWLGWPIRNLLARAGVQPGADMVLSRSVDGFTAGTPLEALTDDRDALLVVGMNGEALPLEHGFPVRLVVPGLFGFVSATKWVTELKVTRFADDAAYWSTRGWSERGPVKTSSRVDVPRSGASVPAGPVTVGGSAWAQHRGIEGVDVRVDGGPWQRAELGTPISVDTWCQYSMQLELAAGSHTVQCRATDNTGEVQSESVLAPAPNGSEGLSTVTFQVTEAG
ncbi:DMSO/TMAO reductase YedYZ molybdopterin-dependent catalytic subunit [Arthrobacter sp. CAN_A6]|uniref:molybdopterin-dependent oxidoreductase n=1 Tax=Arthrobacter sp. CAN_A6 TaxID=2787721 RepID=UPI0018CB5D21